MKSNEAIQIKKKKKKENTFLFFKYHKTEKLNSQTNYQIMISQTVDGIKAIIWNRLSTLKRSKSSIILSVNGALA